MTIEARLARMNDYALRIQGLADEVLQELSSAGFKPATDIPSAPPQTPLVPKTLTPFPVFNEGTYVNELVGQIVYDVEVNTRNMRDGNQKDVANIVLTDGNTQVRIGLWEPLSAAISTYQRGETVTLTNLRVRPPYNNQPQLAGTGKTQIS